MVVPRARLDFPAPTGQDNGSSPRRNGQRQRNSRKNNLALPYMIDTTTSCGFTNRRRSQRHSPKTPTTESSTLREPYPLMVDLQKNPTRSIQRETQRSQTKAVTNPTPQEHYEKYLAKLPHSIDGAKPSLKVQKQDKHLHGYQWYLHLRTTPEDYRIVIEKDGKA